MRVMVRSAHPTWLQQYVGRIHRLHENKREVQVYDYVDIYVPMLMRMFKKRLHGYKTMGYLVQDDDKNNNSFGLRS